MDQVFHANDAKVAKGGLDYLVVRKGYSLAINLGKATLVDQLSDGLEIRIAVGDERLNQTKHLGGRVRQTNKDTVVDLN